MRNSRSIGLVMALVTTLACPSVTLAQPGSAVAHDAVFRSFMRVAQLTGRSATELARIWPAPAGSVTMPTELQLTAAHRLSVQLVPQSGGDAPGTLRSVTYSERLPDTLRLRARVIELLQQLQATIGAPTQCSSPMGVPGYLFAPQDVQRVWDRGIATAPTALRWDVTTSALPTITITVGMIPTPSMPLLPCDARMP